MDADGIHVRTLSVDPSGKVLIAATIRPALVAQAPGNIRLVPAAITTYRIDADGTLGHAYTYHVDTRDTLMFWSGIVPMP